MSSDSQATLPLPGASRGDMDVVDSPELSDSPELTGSQPDGRCAHCEDSEALLAFGVEVMGRTTDEKAQGDDRPGRLPGVLRHRAGARRRRPVAARGRL